MQQKLITLQIFEILEKSAQMGIPPKFLSNILISWRAHRHPIFKKLSRIISKYSDFNFYVATTKNNKVDFG